MSVADAFAAAGLPLPAEHLRSNTTNRDGSPCVRGVQQPAFCVTASHPLTWCDPGGATVRCLTVAESACLMGFPPGWKLPLGSRNGLRAVGNAVRGCDTFLTALALQMEAESSRADGTPRRGFVFRYSGTGQAARAELTSRG